jgi:predicted nucleic-acid-binding protein
MIGLDTNVLVRYIMQDDPRQSPKATVLVESLDAHTPGFVGVVSLIELYWVLTSCYALTNEQVGRALGLLLRTKHLVVERADQVLRALRTFETGKANFADCLIERTAVSAGCSQTMTFDRNAAKHAGMTLMR